MSEGGKCRDVPRTVLPGQMAREGVAAGQGICRWQNPAYRPARPPPMVVACALVASWAAGALYGHMRASRNALSSASRARPLARSGEPALLGIHADTRQRGGPWRLCPHSMIAVEASDQASGLRLAELLAAFSLA